MVDRTTGSKEGAVPEAPTRGPLLTLFPFLAWGIGVASYMVWAKVQLENDPSFKSVCSLGEAFDCDKVQTSQWSIIFDLPIALFAIPTYLLLAYLVWQGLRSQPSSSRPFGLQTARSSVAFAGAIGLLTVLHSAYLFYISWAEIGSFCIFCVSLYVVNLAVLVLTVVSNQSGFSGMIREAWSVGTQFRTPLLSSAVVVVVMFVGSYGVYGSIRDSKQSDYMSGIDDLFAESALEDGGDTDDATPEAVLPSKSNQKTASASAAKAQKPRKTGRAKRRPKPKKTDNGLTYFETPIAEDMWAKGPVDAPVTVVKFADFECGYCRIVHHNMKPLIEKYKKEVQWVMLHYPMNADCNPRMGGERKHEHACDASYGAHCAGVQGKFWEMHDELYDNQQNLEKDEVRSYAEGLGMDMAKWDSCVKDPQTRKKIIRDVRIAGKAFIYGTPKAYVNGRLVSGSASTPILDYYIQKSLEEIASDDGAAPAVVAIDLKASGGKMVKASSSQGDFWIDSFEASIHKDGRAMTFPKVHPTQVSWFQAKEACEKSGKRLCTEEEWVSACAGKPAIDNNNNKYFADDAVEGRMYPYGTFYEQGACRDAEDEYKGQPGKTAVKSNCRTPDGIFDLSGNLAEWVGHDSKRASLVGGDWRTGEYAACNKRRASFGPGIRNNTSGFRCCADTNVTQADVSTDDLRPAAGKLIGSALPEFELPTTDGGTWNTKMAKGKVTYLTFFASWCGSCKRELPELNTWYSEMKKHGFQVVAVGVDKNTKQSQTFAEKYKLTYPVALDEDAKVMGGFDVNAMPTSFIVDRKGIVRHKEVGFKKEEVFMMKKRLKDLLAER